ncbi:uncharacterized protein IWZ02DRAFT_521713 [Phyllosticta citriasiana]|uniref:uncharacterized protein n=1 Tax=Phyllosticta citriasiana TaxID=595635 RepID=UPI0030FD7D1D
MSRRPESPPSLNFNISLKTGKMYFSASVAQTSQASMSALMSFMKHGPGSLIDDEIKPRQVPSLPNTTNRTAKARIDEPDTMILPEDCYPEEFTNKLQQFATLCIEVEQARQLLRNQVKRRQRDTRHKPRVRLAREVLPIDLNTVVRELKEHHQRVAETAAAHQSESGVDSGMDVDSRTSKKSKKSKRKTRGGKKHKPRPKATMDLEMQSLEIMMGNVDLKRKRRDETPEEEDVPASKKVNDALNLSDLARELPVVSPGATRPAPGTGSASGSRPQSAAENDTGESVT